jgi:hypothetical protein
MRLQSTTPTTSSSTSNTVHAIGVGSEPTFALYSINTVCSAVTLSVLHCITRTRTGRHTAVGGDECGERRRGQTHVGRRRVCEEVRARELFGCRCVCVCVCLCVYCVILLTCAQLVVECEGRRRARTVDAHWHIVRRAVRVHVSLNIVLVCARAVLACVHVRAHASQHCERAGRTERAAAVWRVRCAAACGCCDAGTCVMCCITCLRRIDRLRRVHRGCSQLRVTHLAAWRC